MFCGKCGFKISENAKFCGKCGFAVAKPPVKDERKRYKCRFCGEIVESFVAFCPSCKSEMRDVKSSNAIELFSFQLKQAKNIESKVNIIRNVNIPNTREDLREFAIRAKSEIMQGDINGDGKISKEEKSLIEAWKTKLCQCYDKARIMFPNGEEKLMYKDIINEIEKKEKRKGFFAKLFS